MPVVELLPDEFGLVTVASAADFHKCDVRTVQRWIAGGKIPALAVGSGNRTSFLLRERDVKAFKPEPAGRPASKAGPVVKEKQKPKTRGPKPKK